MGSLKQFTTQRPLRPPDPLTTQIDLELFEMPHHSALSISPLLSLSFISSFPFLLYILLNGFVMDDDYNYSGSSGDYICGLAQRNTKIVGGQETEVSEWPWQAGMVWSGSSSVFCGATVISDEWILTAAHCTDGTGANEIQVLLGEHDYWDGSETNMVRMDIAEIVNHAGYDSNTVDNDFALLRMANKLDWAANPHIRPACLPEYTAGGTPPTYDQWMSTVTGWGTTSSGG